MIGDYIIFCCLSFCIALNCWAAESETGKIIGVLDSDEETETSSQAENNSDYDEIVLLRAHEPNILGLRKDENDGAFLDIKLSLKYPLGHDGRYKAPIDRGNFPFFSIAFTGAWAQYVFDRKSSPVIAKRYNPEIFGRWWLRDKHEYIDIMYGHESNGQSIGGWNTYNVKQLEINSIKNPDSGDKIENARDYISRGWDYVGFTYKSGNIFDIPFLEKYEKGNFFHIKTLTLYVKFRYFLDDGLFQGEIEDFNPWEKFGPQCVDDDKTDWTPECYRLDSKYSRDRYDGLTFIFKCLSP